MFTNNYNWLIDNPYYPLLSRSADRQGVLVEVARAARQLGGAGHRQLQAAAVRSWEWRHMSGQSCLKQRKKKKFNFGNTVEQTDSRHGNLPTD